MSELFAGKNESRVTRARESLGKSGVAIAALRRLDIRYRGLGSRKNC